MTSIEELKARLEMEDMIMMTEDQYDDLPRNREIKTENTTSATPTCWGT